ILDFCAAHGIAPEVEMIKIEDINDAFDKIKSEDVRFRYVIDMAK
ncbi:MAG: NAD(P)-dependent alcohol dehydrogenase, partial [Chryseobacterium sp.]|nr:NAD(P)-dependent alcohol dehydrogenase [Chryseobacterium sp.]